MCRSNKVHSNRIPTHKFSSLSSEEVRSLSVRSVLSLDARCNLCGGKEAEEETGTTRSRCFFYFFVEVRNSDIQHFHLHTAASLCSSSPLPPAPQPPTHRTPTGAAQLPATARALRCGAAEYRVPNREVYRPSVADHDDTMHAGERHRPSAPIFRWPFDDPQRRRGTSTASASSRSAPSTCRVPPPSGGVPRCHGAPPPPRAPPSVRSHGTGNDPPLLPPRPSSCRSVCLSCAAGPAGDPAAPRPPVSVLSFVADTPGSSALPGGADVLLHAAHSPPTIQDGAAARPCSTALRTAPPPSRPKAAGRPCPTVHRPRLPALPVSTGRGFLRGPSEHLPSAPPVPPAQPRGRRGARQTLASHHNVRRRHPHRQHRTQ